MFYGFNPLGETHFLMRAQGTTRATALHDREKLLATIKKDDKELSNQNRHARRPPARPAPSPAAAWPPRPLRRPSGHLVAGFSPLAKTSANSITGIDNGRGDISVNLPIYHLYPHWVVDTLL